MKIIDNQSPHAVVDLKAMATSYSSVLASGFLLLVIAMSGCSNSLEDAATPTSLQAGEADIEEPMSTPSVYVAPMTTEPIAPYEEESTTEPVEDPVQSFKQLSGDEIYELTYRSVPLIRTPTGDGAGILVGEGYIVSNYHTVWPFGAAQVVFPEGPNLAEVPVVGWIPSADLAVLGPVNTSLQGLTFADGEGLGPGSELFMVGYSTEMNLFPEVSITRAFLSRFHEWESLGITYIQSDTIASANIDGALLNDRGEVVGVSAPSFRDASLGLVSSATDIAVLVDQLIRDEDDATQGDTRGKLDQANREHKVSLSNRWDTSEFAFEASAGSLVEFWIDGTEDGLFRVFSPTELLIEVDRRLYGRESTRVEIPSTGIYFFPGPTLWLRKRGDLYGRQQYSNSTTGRPR